MHRTGQRRHSDGVAVALVMNPQPGWWDDPAALQRFVCDLLAAELGRIRPGRSVTPLPWHPSLRLDEEGLGADSLDRLKLGTALGEAIHLHRSGIDDSILALPTIGEWIETVARGLSRFSAELTFRTSGSSGEPKWCLHELVDLAAEIDLFVARFADVRRVITTVPSHHIYGFLFTILLPARLRVEVIDVRAASPARLAGLARAGDLVIGHPDYWAAFCRAVPRVGSGVLAVSSTAPCPADVARAVIACGMRSFVEVYGSSETAGIGLRDDPDDAYEIFAYWRRGANDGELLRRLPDGKERRVEAPDRLVWDDAIHIRPAGRREGAVQVGGHNVFPDRVRDVLRQHPGVADAAVRLMLPDEGDRLKAFIVLRDDPPADPAAAREQFWSWIAARLTAPERPTSIEFGPALPAGLLGKRADWPIARGDPRHS